MSSIRKRVAGFARTWLPVFVALTIGYLAADYGRLPETARAEIRKTPRRAAFKSGSERSEVLLREISSTLKQIDARLQRIERIAVKGK